MNTGAFNNHSHNHYLPPYGCATNYTYYTYSAPSNNGYAWMKPNKDKWRCPYCGSINDYADNNCTHCGAIGTQLEEV